MRELPSIPWSSRSYIRELEQDKAMLEGALETAREQAEMDHKVLLSMQKERNDAEAEAERLRAEIAELRSWGAIGGYAGPAEDGE